MTPSNDTNSDTISFLTTASLVCRGSLGRPRDLVRERGHAVDVTQRLDDRAGVHRDAARLPVGVAELPGEALDVAVEHEAHVVAVPVQHGAARIAADDVV